MRCSRSSPADSAGRSVRWQSGTTAAPSTARSTITRASAGACIGSPSRGMRRSETGSYLRLGADVAHALQRYEATRLGRTARLQLTSRQNTWGRHKVDPDWVYGYDVWQAPICGSAQLKPAAAPPG